MSKTTMLLATLITAFILQKAAFGGDLPIAVLKKSEIEQGAFEKISRDVYFLPSVYD